MVTHSVDDWVQPDGFRRFTVVPVPFLLHCRTGHFEQQPWFPAMHWKATVPPQDMNITASERPEIARKIIETVTKMSVSNRKFCFVIWCRPFSSNRSVHRLPV
jgi:hypothetical protein